MISSPPSRLYKYRAINEYTLDLLVNTEMYYSPPSAFNDPLDSKIEISGTLDVRELEELVIKLDKGLCGPFHGEELLNYFKYMSSEYGNLKTSEDAKNYYVDSLTHSVKERIDKLINNKGVLSLASRWNCPLMWSHYSNEHKGICIEYSTENSRFRDLRRISYGNADPISMRDVYDFIVRSSSAAKEKINQRVFFTKAKEWRYEKEWRDMRENAGPNPSPAIPTGIIFGLRSSFTTRYTVVNLFHNSDLDIKFYRIHKKSGSFALLRRRLDMDEISFNGIREPVGWEFD